MSLRPSNPGTPVVAALAVALAASILAPLALSGRPAWWGLPGFVRSAPLRAIVVTAAIAGALYLVAWLIRRPWPVASRVVAVAGAGLALAAVFRAVAIDAPIGDAMVLARSVEDLKPFGKWYGASLAFGIFHQTIGAPAGLDALESIRWGSALAGATGALLFERLAARTGLHDVLRAWPFLYAGAFGAVGVGLGHVEVYSLVVALLLAILLAGAAVIDAPAPRRVLVLALLVAAGLVAYIGFVLVLPAWLGLSCWLVLRGRADRRVAVAALAGVLVVALLAPAVLAFGPTAEYRPMQDEWSRQFLRGESLNQKASPPFLPADVHWPLVTNFITPKYWFSGWHLRDLGQLAFLGDRAGLLLGAALLIPALRRGGGRSKRLAWFGAVAAAYLGYAALVVHGMPYPWDWDLTSPAFATTAPLAAGLLVAAARGRRYPRAVDVLLVVTALAAQLSGAMLFAAAARPPAEFGAVVEGLRLGVDPPSLRLEAGAPVYVTLWLRNERTAPVTITRGDGVYALVANRGGWLIRSRTIPRRMLAGKTVPPGSTAWFMLLKYIPEQMQVSDDGGRSWRAGKDLAPSGTYTGRWLSPLRVAGQDATVDLTSGTLAVTVTPETLR